MPYACRCFVTGLNGALLRFFSGCSAVAPSSSVSAVLQALPNLGLSVASVHPAGSSPWGYNLASFLIQVPPSLSLNTC